MTHPTPYDLDLYVAKEQTTPRAQEISAHLASCAQCRERLSERMALSEEMLARRPVAAFVDEVENRSCTSPPQASRRYLWFLAPAAAAACVVFLSLLAPGFLSPKPDVTDSSRPMTWRGQAPAVHVYVQRGDEITLLRDRALAPGDKLRYEVTLPEDRVGYAAVFAVEEGKASLLLPETATATGQRVSGRTMITGSVEITAGGPAVVLALVVRDAPLDTVATTAQLEAAWARGQIDAVEGVVHKVWVEP